MASSETDDENRRYKVVVNHEEQYSVWPEGRPAPAGWSETGEAGPKDACLEYIGRVWTDMRPLSIRAALDAGGSR
nr:MbtH family protein [Catenulispora sp.]